MLRRHAGVIALSSLALALGVSCLEITPVGDSTGALPASGGASASGTGGFGNTPDTIAKTDKVDLLLAIDNSISMSDKQTLLSLMTTELIEDLANPPCVDEGGTVFVGPGSGVPCPGSSKRVYPPIRDLHIGVISSSLGGHGSDECRSSNVSNDDRAHLLARTAPASPDTVPTYQGSGFLAWDPKKRMNPAGDQSLANVETNLQAIIGGVGERGCEFPSQLESWYRFLVDPEPALQTVLVNGIATPDQIDTLLLGQRRDFLRYDSLVAILEVSDKNDCSTKEYGAYYLSNQGLDPASSGKPYRMPRGSESCATDPGDACCFPCNGPTPAGCPDSALCATTPTWDAEGDPLSLRCWDQKRRFGADFLYPLGRYVDGLSQSMIASSDGQLVPNQLFVDPSGKSPSRDPSWVVLESIVGVPWPDLARDPFDLSAGYLSGFDLAAQGRWQLILGDDKPYAVPIDPLMREAVDPRSGQNPLTNEPLAPPSAPNQNSINGNERTIGARDDLQYACVLPLFSPRDCSLPNTQSCDCTVPMSSPLCAPNQNDGGAPTLQIRAKAYPGLRQLELTRRLGPAALAGSICTSQISEPTRADYLYRAAGAALVSAIAARITP